MRAGVGYSKCENAYQCGYQVGERAIKSGSIIKPSFALGFCTKDLEVDEYAKGLRAALGNDATITGGTVVGVIANEDISHGEQAAAAMVLQFETTTFRTAFVRNIDQNAERGGCELLRRLDASPGDKLMLMLYDMVKTRVTEKQPPELNSILALLKAYNASGVPLFGGGLISDFDLSPSKLFYNDAVHSKSASAVVFNGDIKVYTTIMHGCTPLDGAYHTITRKKGKTILELDGLPADVLIDEIFQSTAWRRELPVRDLTIARNYGAKYEPFREENYINRLIPGSAVRGKGIVIPEQDWKVGTEIQFMIRDNEGMIDSTLRNTKKLLQRIKADDKKPVLGIYIDCAGRTACFSNSIQEEASIVQSIFNNIGTPLLGFYSGMEIATVNGKYVGQEWTGLLVVIARN